MNIYAINLVRKWNKLSSQHDDFANYVKHVFSICKDSDNDLKKMKEHNSPGKIFINLSESALLSFFVTYFIVFIVSLISLGFQLPFAFEFFQNIPQISLIAGALTIAIFTYVHFFKEPHKLKEKFDSTALVLRTFKLNVIDEIENYHNFQKISNILEKYIPQKDLKQILIHLTDKQLNTHDLHYIYVALNEYYLSNINTKNFESISALLDNSEIPTSQNQVDHQDIQFFAK